MALAFQGRGDSALEEGCSCQIWGRIGFFFWGWGGGGWVFGGLPSWREASTGVAYGEVSTWVGMLLAKTGDVGIFLSIWLFRSYTILLLTEQPLLTLL